MKRKAFAVLYFLLGSTLIGRAEDAGPTSLSLDRIISSDEFRSDSFGPARWLADGSGYTTVEASASGQGRDIVKYDPASGRRSILVASSKLVPKKKDRPLGLADYQWSNDGTKLLIFTNTRRVWRQNTRGDYWVLDLKSNELRKLGGDAPEATLQFAKFDTGGRRAAYVRANNLYVEDLADGKITPITTDGSETKINGTFDWVYEEEFSLRDGFRWSPDGRSIAYWQLNTEGMQDFYLINYTTDLYPKLTPIRYPKVGRPNPSCRIGVVSASGGSTRWMDVTGDPKTSYIARMDWAANSAELMLQHVNRLQNSVDVILADVKTGHCKTILAERDEAWVDIGDDLQWLDDGKRFTWTSERDGRQGLYVASRSGGTPKRVTDGTYDVVSVVRVDPKTGEVDFIAAPNEPTRRYLYRTSIDGPEKSRRLTPMDQPGTHSYQISPDGKWTFHTYSTMTRPSIIELIGLPDHNVVRTLVDNAKLRSKVAALKGDGGEFFRIDIGNGVLLDGWMIKPADFDPSKKYPLIMHVYGEPAGQTVLDRWGGRHDLWHRMLAQKGYLVASVDNRGTPAPRGRAWRKSIYRQIGILASKDQADAVKALEVSRPYIDAERVGVWGWSGGGSMTLNAIFRYPELYRTGIAIAFISDQRLYDTIYQERYMGLPEGNPDGYRDGSPINFAHRLKGNLLLIHGTGDDNCHYQNCERLINTLVAANKPFEMMAYPNRSHSISEGQGTSRHLYETMTRYFLRNLEPGPKPRP